MGAGGDPCFLFSDALAVHESDPRIALVNHSYHSRSHRMVELIFKPLRYKVVGQHAVTKPIDGNVTNGARDQIRALRGLFLIILKAVFIDRILKL